MVAIFDGIRAERLINQVLSAGTLDGACIDDVLLVDKTDHTRFQVQPDEAFRGVVQIVGQASALGRKKLPDRTRKHGTVRQQQAAAQDRLLGRLRRGLLIEVLHTDYSALAVKAPLIGRFGTEHQKGLPLIENVFRALLARMSSGFQMQEYRSTHALSRICLLY